MKWSQPWDCSPTVPWNTPLAYSSDIPRKAHCESKFAGNTGYTTGGSRSISKEQPSGVHRLDITHTPLQLSRVNRSTHPENPPRLWSVVHLGLPCPEWTVQLRNPQQTFCRLSKVRWEDDNDLTRLPIVSRCLRVPMTTLGDCPDPIQP